MPNCFQLISKADPKAGAVSLHAIDRELCEYFKADCHERWYYHGWFDWIGYMLASNKTFEQIKAGIEDDLKEHEKWDVGEVKGLDYLTRMMEIALYLEERYTARNWVEIGKRP